jgi:ubiquinone/menaquinone biosynthesis C-methylase UbiE
MSSSIDNPPPDPRQSAVTAHFEDQSRQWETIYQAHDVVSVIHQHRLALALSWIDRLKLPAGTRVLEIGCGAGLAAVALAERCFDVQATDVTDVMLDRARERAAHFGVSGRVRFEHADVHALQFPNDSFELVLALGLFPWLHSQKRATSEIARVLRPDGYLVVTIGNRLRLPWMLDPRHSPALAPGRRMARGLLDRIGRPWRSPDEPQTNPVSGRELHTLLASAGLEIITAATFGFGPFTLLDHEFLSDRLSLAVNRQLQRLADRGVPVLRAAGAQHIALARKRAPSLP